ncbi:MAG: Gmad2 immunoglobulin-like domain-containing protein [Actinomycetota bacterium]|nr:Gmad2 immunoglobulin-like domain-containing protein [Actinomycetota bacterium]
MKGNNFMEIRHKYINICVISIVVVVLFFGLSLNSCRAKSPSDKESGVTGSQGTLDEEGKKENNQESLEGKTETEEGNDARGKDEQEELVAEEGLAENETPVDSGKIAQENENIRVSSPLQNQVVTSPLVITGEARGTWFFEACFPVKLLDGNGEEIAAHYATALSDWMTEDFVPFEATIEFEKPDTEIGFLVLKKDNPTGLPEFDDELVITVRFE